MYCLYLQESGLDELFPYVGLSYFLIYICLSIIKTQAWKGISALVF